MRRRSDGLATVYAAEIRPLLAEASRAYGAQKQGSPARVASDRVNQLLLMYDNEGGNITQLSEYLAGDISLPGLRRRLRVARKGVQLGLPADGRRRFRGSRDEQRIAAAAERIRKVMGTSYYGVEVRRAHDENLSLAAIAEELGISYFSLWSAMTTSGT